MKSQRVWAWLSVVIPVLLFLGATLPYIDLPGLQYDEVYYIPPIAALWKHQYDADYVMLDPSVIRLWNRPLPLMFNYYTSFLRTYLTWPLFALGGINVYTIRGSSIALGAIALIFFIAFARRLTHRHEVAFASGIFLALDASFIAYMHNDNVAVSLMMALKGGALWALLRWWQQSQTRFLFLGAFLIGLGITDRASFLWIPMALAPTLLFLYGKRLWQEIRSRVRHPKELVWAVSAFALGASIFLAFNVATLGGTFSPMLGNLEKTSGGANNLAFLENLYLRLQMLTDMLNGGYLNHFILGEVNYQTSGWHFSGSPMSWLAPLAFSGYFMRTLAQYWTRQPLDRAALFLMSMTFGILLFTCFTPTVHRGQQLLMLYPFPHILAAMFIFALPNWVHDKWQHFTARAAKLVGFSLMVFIGIAAARPIFVYHQMLQQTGGRGVWSDAICDIVAEVERHPDRNVVCMDWGFNANILSLAKQPVRTIRNYYDNARRPPEQLAQLFDSTHVFLLHAREYTYMPAARKDFLTAVTLANARVDTVRIFYQHEGQPVAYLLRAYARAQWQERHLEANN